MATDKYCECCATTNSLLIDMKTKEFDCDGQKLYIIDMFKKILKVFVPENMLNGEFVFDECCCTRILFELGCFSLSLSVA
jgi:hypothetical protein